MAPRIVHECCPHCNAEITPGACIQYCAPQRTYQGHFDGRSIAAAATRRDVTALVHDYVFDLLEQGMVQGDVLNYLADVVLTPTRSVGRCDHAVEVDA